MTITSLFGSAFLTVLRFFELSIVITGSLNWYVSRVWMFLVHLVMCVMMVLLGALSNVISVFVLVSGWLLLYCVHEINLSVIEMILRF